MKQRIIKWIFGIFVCLFMLGLAAPTNAVDWPEQQLAFWGDVFTQDKSKKERAVVSDGRTYVAILLPLSGPEAKVGQVLLRAAQQAVMDYADENFVLLPFDTKGTSQGAAEAMGEALNYNIRAVLGPLFAHSVQAIRYRAQAEDLPVFSFSNDTSIAAEGVYAMGFAPRAQVTRLVDYAANEGFKKFAVLAPSTAYGTTVTEAFEYNLAAYDGELIDGAYYGVDTKDYTEVAKRIANFDARHAALNAAIDAIKRQVKDGSISKAEGDKLLDDFERQDSFGNVEFEALLIADGGSRLRSLLPLLPYYDINPRKVQLMGLSLWESLAFNLNEPAMRSSIFVGPDPKGREKMELDFKSAWAINPPRLATIAYDAAALTAVLARIDDGDPDFSEYRITNSQGYEGVDGIYRLNGNGTVERGYAILGVAQNGDVRVVSPAPKSF